MLMWIAFFIGLIACGMLSANERVSFAWVVLVLASVRFRLTQPVRYVAPQYGVAHAPGD